MSSQLTSKLYLPLIFIAIFGFGLLFHPFTIEKEIGANAYLTLGVGFAVAVIGIWLIKELIVRYPGQTVIDWGQNLLGRGGWVGSLLLLLTLLIFSVLSVRRVTELIGTSILFLTPEWANILAYTITIAYMARLGTTAIGRLCSLFIGLGVLFSLNLILGVNRIYFDHVHPAAILCDLGYLKYWWVGIPGFIPALLFLAFIRNKDVGKTLPGIVLTTLLGALILSFISFEIVGIFGPDGVKRYPRAVVAFMGTVHLASEYFFQSIVVTIYLFIFTALSLTVSTIILRIFANGVIDFFTIRNSQWVIPGLALLIYFGALLPNLLFFNQYNNPLLLGCSFFIIAYLCLLWVLSRFRRPRRP